MADLAKQDSKVSENKVAEVAKSAGSEAGSLTDDQLSEVTGGVPTISEIVVTKKMDSSSPGLWTD